MANIEIYTTKTCPYCMKAKALLASKNINLSDIKEIDVSDDENLRADMTKRAGGKRTVPQIFIDNNHIGGFDDINSLDKKGELDKLLNIEKSS